MCHLFRFCFVLCLLSALSHNTHASSITQVSASANYLFLKHANYNNAGYTLNEEKGWLPGAQLAISSASNQLKSTFLLEKYTGNITYDGQATSGAIRSITNQSITKISYRLDDDQPRKNFRLYGALSFQNWNRNIQPNGTTQGLNRQYQWGMLEGGMRFGLYSSRQTILCADIGFSRTFFSKLFLDLSEYNLGKPLLYLTDRFGLSTSFSLTSMLKKSTGFILYVKTNYWQFGQSSMKIVQNGTETVNLKEPESQSLTSTFGASYFFEF